MISGNPSTPPGKVKGPDARKTPGPEEARYGGPGSIEAHSDDLPAERQGTKVSTDVLEATSDSLFPLQGALGYEIHQSLFICDVRLNPRSRVPHWNKGRLAAACAVQGITYVHVNALGNSLYRSGGIELLDPVGGIAELAMLMAEEKVVVMCMCKKVDGCHRAEVLRLAQAMIPGLLVVEV